MRVADLCDGVQQLLMRLLLVDLIFSISVTSIPVLAVEAFVPAPPPRFDAFLERILGPWHQNDGGPDVLGTAGEVEEVMRSCGGAVQGIREIAISSRSTDDADDEDSRGAYYWNRADDGFIFHDNGSYTVGPTKLPPDDNASPSSSQRWTTSLSLDPSCRVRIDSCVTDPDGTVGDTRYFGLVRGALTDRVLDLKVLAERQAVKDPNDAEEAMDGDWSEQLRCRMSSLSQPWMRQRAKWEKVQHDNDEPRREVAMANHGGDNNAEISSVVAWARRVSLADGSVRITAGAAVAATGAAQAYCREYQPNGNLASVTWMCGKIDCMSY